VLYNVQGTDGSEVSDFLLLDYLHHVTTQNSLSNVVENRTEYQRIE
jgi:hypothetical protein